MNTTARTLQPPSEAFLDALFTPGNMTASAECELCGRIHYDATNDDSRARYEPKRDREPSAYFAHDGQPCHSWINGQQVVRGCPCNKLAAFESFMWESRWLFVGFIEARANVLAAEAIHEREPAKRARQALQKLPA